MENPDPRWNGLRPLVGDRLQQLHDAHVLIVGVGGVGSWAAEALARSGIGTLSLLDGDEICITNINRQVQALTSTIGRPKIEVLRERIQDINPACTVYAQQEFFHYTTADRHLAQSYDWVIDATDGVLSKASLIGECKARGLQVITSGGAGALTNPEDIRVMDLGATSHDRLLTFIRKKLRKHYQFSDQPFFDVPCVCSQHERIPPTPCVTPADELVQTGSQNCEGGLGSFVGVTAVFGLVAASYIINSLTNTDLTPQT